MIGHLKGNYIGPDEGGVLIDVAGVGYSVLVPSRVTTSWALGRSVELFIHTNLRENSLELFGFSTLWEKKVFYALTSVSGVGPRTAIAMLSAVEAEALLTAIAREDRAALGGVPGVGKKTAERLILELGEKARKLLQEARLVVPSQGASAKNEHGAAEGGGAFPDTADVWNEAVSALVGLGYSEADAIVSIRKTWNESAGGVALSLEELVKKSLRVAHGRR